MSYIHIIPYLSPYVHGLNMFTLWLFNIAMEAMAHRNRLFSQLETSIYGWDFPWLC